MAYALIANTTVDGPNGGTSGGIDTTGANLLVVSVSWYAATTADVTVSDSPNGGGSNTWATTTKRSGLDYREQIFYVYGGTVGPNHTFTVAGLSTFSSLMVQAWSGSVTSPFDQENGAASFSGAVLSTGSVTPTQDNELVVTGLSFENNSGATIAVDNGFTISNTVPYGSGDNIGGSMAYKLQTTATAVNPQWNATNAAIPMIASIVTFKAAAVGGGLTDLRVVLGEPTIGSGSF